MADIDELRALRKEIAEVRARLDSYEAPAPAAKTPAVKGKASDLERMVDQVDEQRTREARGRADRYERETSRGWPTPPSTPAAFWQNSLKSMTPYRYFRPSMPAAAPPFQSGMERAVPRAQAQVGKGAGLRSPQRQGGPVNEFMEESIYPAFDRLGKQTPFWSPLMSIGETGLGEDYWTWLQYWNELMRGPRRFMRG
jgi:hypothetical protein